MHFVYIKSWFLRASTQVTSLPKKASEVCKR